VVRPARRPKAEPVDVEISPPVPGIVILSRGDLVVYVQYAIDCRALVVAVAARKVIAFDRAAYVPCPVERLEATEAAFVARYKPEHNRPGAPPVRLAHLLRARDTARAIIVSHGRQGVGWPDLVATTERAMGGAAVDRLTLGKLLDLDPAVRWVPASLAYRVAG
jgi:hypothetical protein